jgi:large subunit ribosomal protein L21
MFAVIETGGKQYRVAPGAKLKIEKLEAAPEASVTFDKVLLTVDGDTVVMGTPTVKGASVTAKVLGQERADKLIVFKYRHKVRRRTKNTHRQPYTEVEITSIK